MGDSGSEYQSQAKCRTRGVNFKLAIGLSSPSKVAMNERIDRYQSAAAADAPQIAASQPVDDAGTSPVDLQGLALAIYTLLLQDMRLERERLGRTGCVSGRNQPR